MKRIILYSVLILLLSHFSFPQIGGYALKFDGSSNYVDIPYDFGDPNVLTIELWFKTTTISWGCLFGQTSAKPPASPVGGWIPTLVMKSDGTIRGEFWPNPGVEGSITSSLAYNDDKWHHIAFTANGSTQTLYIDGVSVGTRSVVTDNSWWTYSSIGTGYGSTVKGFPSDRWYYFNGSIDEVRIWNAARTQSEIKANMYKEIGANANLKAYYSMSNGSGTSLTDNSGNSNAGTLTNGPEWKASGCFAGPRQALDLDGTDDYVNLPAGFSTSFNNLEHFSFCGWVCPKNIDNALWSTFFTRYSSVDWNRVTFHQLPNTHVQGSDDILISISNTSYGEAYTNTNVLQANTWVHLAVVFDGSGVTNAEKIKVYVNGKEETLVFPSGINFPPTISSSYTNAFLGRYANGDYFNGSFDDFSFWSKSLSAGEIHEIMHRSQVGNETNLFAYYRFDHTDGTTLYDNTANGYNGTLTNMDAGADWVSSSAFNTWIGSESNSWSVAANWSSGTAPAATDNVGLYKWDLGNETFVSGTPTVNNLLFSSTASPSLTTGFTVNGNLVLEKNIDLNGQTITLSNTGVLVEGSGVLSGASGKITSGYLDISSASSYNVAGFGAIISTGISLGICQFKRGHTEQTQNGNKSILRYYDLATNMSGKDKGVGHTLVFTYLESEINGIVEEKLTLVRSTNTGTDWAIMGGTVDALNNTVTLTNISDVSGRWTLADSDHPLPVELTSFSSETFNGRVKLNWSTATEVNNYGFEVERSLSSHSSSLNGHSLSKVWETIGFVAGSGSSNSPREYSFENKIEISGKYSFRLKQIDNDGKFVYSNEIEVEAANVPTEYSLLQNYPNPFNPSTVISYQLPVKSFVSLKLYDITGTEIATLVNEMEEAGVYNYELRIRNSELVSGVYIYMLKAGEFVSTKKLVLMK